MTRPKAKILVDAGDPQETRQVMELLGFVDGQTTNPSLIAKNPHIKELIASGHREEMDKSWQRHHRRTNPISEMDFRFAISAMAA
jgi:transaldolase